MIELLGDRTGNCLRVAIALEEAGIAYTARRVDLSSGEQHKTDFLSVNPAGKVPTLIEHRGGKRFVLSQSLAIMLWVSQRASGRLMPAVGTAAHAIALERLFMVATDLIAPTHASSYLKRSDELIASRRLDGLVMARMGWLENLLHRQPYLAGAQFSLADVAAVTLVGSIHALHHWRENPGLTEWYARVSARDGVRRGMKAFQRDVELAQDGPARLPRAAKRGSPADTGMPLDAADARLHGCRELAPESSSHPEVSDTGASTSTQAARL